jgi:hypothetical protein
MNTVKRQIIEIPIDKLSGLDRMFGSMMNLDIENIPAKFRSAFGKTKETSYQHFTMTAGAQPLLKARIPGLKNT